MIAEEVFVNCYRYYFSPITEARIGHFQGILKNYPEAGSEPEPQFGCAAPRSRKKYFRLNYTD
jgi:hypothetical protein